MTWVRPALGAETGTSVSFRGAWPRKAARPWPGPEYWSNPLQDWRIRDGRLECFSPGGDRNVVLLTREVAGRSGDLLLSVRLGRLDTAPLEGGFAGFRVGIRNPHGDYRAVAIYGQGLNAGISADGRLFIGTLEAAAPKVDLADEIHLTFSAQPSASGYKTTLHAESAHGNQHAEIARRVSSCRG